MMPGASEFAWGGGVDHPWWRWQAAGGAFAVWCSARPAGGAARPARAWLAVSANATVGGILIGWTVANVPIESLGVGGWLRSLVFAAVALLTPPVLSAAMLRGTPLPRLSALIGPVGERIGDPVARAIGGILIAVMLLAILVALGLVFDPRYKDFPFAPLTAAVLPILLHSLLLPRPGGQRGTAELAGAGVLALAVPYIVFNEGLANWQSLWTCAALAALAISLLGAARQWPAVQPLAPTARYYKARCRSRRRRAPPRTTPATAAAD